jgi:hypothetical protein
MLRKVENLVRADFLENSARMLSELMLINKNNSHKFKEINKKGANKPELSSFYKLKDYLSF